jgi:hypothetical protein
MVLHLSRLAALGGACKIVVLVIGLIAMASISAFAQPTTSAGSGCDFMRSIVGEWVGICEQSTDGEQADDKYFHVVITQVGENTFNGQFEYYRLDQKTGDTLRAGDTSIAITANANGSLSSIISGKGTVLVQKSPKNQRHEFTETLVYADGKLRGEGKGTIKVDGMPLGIGKTGKIQQSVSQWSLENGMLKVSQNVRVGFRALIFSKTFDLAANYTARRGSDLAGLMNDKEWIARFVARAPAADKVTDSRSMPHDG